MRPRLNIRLLHLTNLLQQAASRFGEVEAHRLAAALAFYTLSAIFPLMLVVISIGKLVLGDSPTLQNSLVSSLDATHSTAVRGLIEETLASLSHSKSENTWGIVVGTIGSIFAASGIFMELDSAMHKLFRLPPAEGSFLQGLKRTIIDRATALGLVIVTGLLLLFGTVLLGAVELVSAHFPAVAQVFPGVVSELTSISFMALALTLCYRVIPDEKVVWPAALRGGIVAALGLQLARWPLTFAALHLTNYSAYGVLGTLLLLATWIYIAGCILLFGAGVTSIANQEARTRGELDRTAKRDANDPPGRHYSSGPEAASAGRT